MESKYERPPNDSLALGVLPWYWRIRTGAPGPGHVSVRGDAMSLPEGVVTQVDGDEVYVLVSRSKGCSDGSCSADGGGHKSCSTCSSSSPPVEVRARLNGYDVLPGDVVRLEVPQLTKVILLVYVFPLAGFIVPLVLMSMYAPQAHELVKAGVAFGGLVASVLALRLIRPIADRHEGFQVQVVKVVERRRRPAVILGAHLQPRRS